MADKEESERGFTIVDRRSSAGKSSSESSSDEPKSDEASGEGQPPIPGVDFASFVLSLGTSALYHLGLIGDPETGKPVAKPDRLLVQQTIDTLAMLETKTRGNLDPEEAKLLDGLLYELRMHYVEARE
jgi:hypothetical protein